jgi:hypothetical protein
MRTIKLRFADLDFVPGFGATSRFYDGTSYGAHPHDAPHYWHLAFRCGYEGDVFKYCQEHELAHHLVSELFDRPSPILWALAHGEKPAAWLVPAEEALVLCLQKYARTNEHPFVDGIDWKPLRERFLQLAE